MEITFAPKGILQIDDARITYRNFSGAPGPYNREGDRNFSLILPPDTELLDRLQAEGWSIKVKPPRNEDEDIRALLPVKIKVTDRGPNVYLKSGNNLIKLDADRMSILDNIDILSVDLDIRPYDWEMNGKSGRTAYLQSIRVTQRIDRFAAEEEELF